MTTGELIVVATAIFVAIVAYLVAGFGFALLAMPIMTFAIPVEQAVAVVLLLAIVSTAHQASVHRHAVRLALARRLTLASFAGMPVGLWILNVVDDRTLRLVLGVAVVVATAMLVRDVTLEHVGPGLDYSMGFVSGVANASIGTNGPPLVFDLQSRRLAPTEFRATIAAVFAFGNLFTFVLFVADGKITRSVLGAAGVAFPAWLAGAGVGRALQRRVPDHQVRRIVLGLLFATGVTTVATAI